MITLRCLVHTKLGKMPGEFHATRQFHKHFTANGGVPNLLTCKVG